MAERMSFGVLDVTFTTNDSVLFSLYLFTLMNCEEKRERSNSASCITLRQAVSVLKSWGLLGCLF